MSHDIQDLLNLIKELEERIIKLESAHTFKSEDSGHWYWDH